MVGCGFVCLGRECGVYIWIEFSVVKRMWCCGVGCVVGHGGVGRDGDIHYWEVYCVKCWQYSR